jgi:hypothetical protein
MPSWLWPFPLILRKLDRLLAIGDSLMSFATDALGLIADIKAGVAAQGPILTKLSADIQDLLNRALDATTPEEKAAILAEAQATLNGLTAATASLQALEDLHEPTP